MKTATAAACAAIAAAGLAASAAQANKPDITHVKNLPAVYDDDEMCTGFSPHVDGSDKYSVQDFYDKDGNLTREVFHDEFTGTVTYGSVTLNKTESANITFDFATGNETWQGLAVRYAYPDGRIITQDTGTIVFDENGDVIREQGPHPYADGPGNDAVCNALSS